MQVELVRDLINLAINEPDIKTREGVFWTFSEAYDEYVPSLKKFFSDENLKEMKSEGFEIKRMNNLFLIEDCHGEKDFFSQEELGLLFIYGKDHSN